MSFKGGGGVWLVLVLLVLDSLIFGSLTTVFNGGVGGGSFVDADCSKWVNPISVDSVLRGGVSSSFVSGSVFKMVFCVSGWVLSMLVFVGGSVVRIVLCVCWWVFPISTRGGLEGSPSANSSPI